MRILHITDSFTAGGLERFIIDINQAMKGMGHLNYYALGNESIPDGFPETENVICGFSFIKGDTVTGFEFIDDVSKLKSIIVDNRIDCVICHPFRCLFPAVVASQLTQTPIAYVVHGTASLSFPTSVAENLLFRASIQHAISTMFTVNKLAVSQIRTNANVVAIPQPIAIDHTEMQNQTTQSNRVWTLASRLDTDKTEGIRAFLKMVPYLPIDHIHLYGNGNDKNSISEFAKSIRIASKLTLHDYDENWLNKARAHSFGVIGLGRAALEAASTGMPVLMLSPNQNPCGMLTQPLYEKASLANFNGSNLRKIDNVQLLASQIEEVYDRPQTYNLKNLVQLNHSIDTVGRKIIYEVQSSLSRQTIQLIDWQRFLDFVSSQIKNDSLFGNPAIYQAIRWHISNVFPNFELRSESLDLIYQHKRIYNRDLEISELTRSITEMQIQIAQLDESRQKTQSDLQKTKKTTERQQSEIKRQQSEIKRQQSEIKTIRQELSRIKKSRSWKIGRAVTWLPRKIRKLSS